MDFLGVDIGCTSIKYGLVNLDEKIKVSNFDMIFVPQISITEKYIDSIQFLTDSLSSYQAGGFGFPSIVRDNHIRNLTIEYNEIWLRTIQLFQKKNIPCFALNDADAAGVAEVYRREAGQLRKGVTVVITLGTGIGSAVFLDGKLLPNTEMGLFEMHGMRAENYTAPSVKTKECLSWVEWSCRLQEYLFILEKLLSPDHIVIGGGISADFEEYYPLLSTHAPLQPAFYRNQAGVIGSAMYAAYQIHHIDLS